MTKIIATVGPACDSIEKMAELIESGARVFRLNFSHGDMASFQRMHDIVRAASKQINIPVAIFGDLCGPKIRLSKIADQGIDLADGQLVHFQKETCVGHLDPNGDVRLSTNYEHFVQEVQEGQRVLINDGQVRLLALDKDETQVTCSVMHGGKISSAKGINLPETDLSVPAITDYDWQCVTWAIARNLDFLALSFVRSAEDILQLKAFLDKHTPATQLRIPVIAKIEKPQALDDLDRILINSDAVMVARGDLGVEMDLARVPIVQKRIIALAHDYGKPVIVATQMLESMIQASMPTRAEVSDVANAVYDGADAIMLSGETAVGAYPSLAVDHMARICHAIQGEFAGKEMYWGKPPRKLKESKYRTAALAHGVMIVARDIGAKCIVVWSQRGGGARYLSENRPTIPIIAASSDPVALRRMAPLFAVYPIQMETPDTIEQFIKQIDQRLLSDGWAVAGDSIVVVSGEPLGMSQITNKMRIHYLGDVCHVSG